MKRRVTVQVKLSYSLTMRAIPERIRDISYLGAIQIDITFTFTTLFEMCVTETGRLMARFCVAFNTMKIFHGITGRESMEELVSNFFCVTVRSNHRRAVHICSSPTGQHLCAHFSSSWASLFSS